MRNRGKGCVERQEKKRPFSSNRETKSFAPSETVSQNWSGKEISRLQICSINKGVSVLCRKVSKTEIKNERR